MKYLKVNNTIDEILNSINDSNNHISLTLVNTTKEKRKKIRKSITHKVLADGNLTCCKCGLIADTALYSNGCGLVFFKGDVLFTKDHIIPKAAGGSTKPFNLQSMCKPCNLNKGGIITESLKHEIDQAGFKLSNVINTLKHKAGPNKSKFITMMKELYISGHSEKTISSHKMECFLKAVFKKYQIKISQRDLNGLRVLKCSPDTTYTPS